MVDKFHFLVTYPPKWPFLKQEIQNFICLQKDYFKFWKPNWQWI